MGNLTDNLTGTDVETLSTPSGTLQGPPIIIDRGTDPSKRLGVMERDPLAAAQASIRGLDGQDHTAQKMTGDEAKPREARAGGGGYVGSRHGGGGGGGHGGGASRY